MLGSPADAEDVELAEGVSTAMLLCSTSTVRSASGCSSTTGSGPVGTIRIDGGLVTGVYLVRNPDKLRRVVEEVPLSR